MSLLNWTLLSPVTEKVRLLLHSGEAKCLSHTFSTGEPSSATRKREPPVDEAAPPEASADAAMRSINSPARAWVKQIARMLSSWANNGFQ